jgi:ElaB/YqjD/DUF883 family membrane-anchored ribosome-binding protein
MSRDRDPDDLATLLDDLRTTLDELERTLDAEGNRPERSRPEGRGTDQPRSPTTPRGSDIVRFTEEYTIPTVIAILETTIQSLELLRGVLRLADPDRRFAGGRDDRDGRRIDGVDRRVVEGTERALDDLRRVLTGTEEPSDPVARDVFREARELTAEIESRLAEARDEPGRSRSDGRPGRDGRRESVVIPVDDEDGTGEESADGGNTDTEDSGVEIDVDAELESIRDEVRESERADRNGEEAEGDGNDGDGNG